MGNSKVWAEVILAEPFRSARSRLGTRPPHTTSRTTMCATNVSVPEFGVGFVNEENLEEFV
jgi:hypothetical protein